MYIGTGDEEALNGTCEPCKFKLSPHECSWKISLFFAVTTDYVALLNATIYYAEISTETPMNTPVFRIRLSINADRNPLDVVLRFYQPRIQDLFEFENGENNGIEISFPSGFTLIGNEYIFDTSINFLADEAALDRFSIDSYPLELDITITLSLLLGDLTPYGDSAQAIGSIFLAPGKCIAHITFLPHIIFTMY